MTDIMRLLPRCPYAGKCAYPCVVAGTGESLPLLTIKAGDNPGELVVTCHNQRAKQEGQDQTGY